MVPQVDFDIVDSILRVLEGWELGNKGLYRKYRSYKKIIKISNFILVPAGQKNDVLDFSGNVYEKMAGNWGISSETTWESRVRRPGNWRRLLNCRGLLN